MNVALATPAHARLCSVDVPTLWKLTRCQTTLKPSISLSNSGRTASGVTSRPVRPVPPVVTTASIIGSAIHLRITARMAFTSSGTMALSASSCPASRHARRQQMARRIRLIRPRIRDRHHADAQRLERHRVDHLPARSGQRRIGRSGHRIYSVFQRACASRSSLRGSIHSAPSGRTSRFQNGASVFRRSIR